MNTAKKAVKIIALGLTLCSASIAVFWGGGVLSRARADLGGGDFGGGLGEAIPVPILWSSDETGGHYALTGVDTEYLDLRLAESPFYSPDNCRIYIPMDDYEGLPYIIGDNAFKASHYGYTFTELDFEKASDYENYTEDMPVSYLAAIGENSFEGGAFKAADMSGLDLLTSIGKYAFYNCKQLYTVDLSGSAVKSIGDRAFAGCAELYSVNLNNCSGVMLGKGAFEYCVSLTALDLKNSGLNVIGDSAFGNCAGLRQIDFAGAPVTEIGERAFYGSGLEALDLTGLKDLIRIKPQAFGNCQSLKTVRMGYVPDVSADIFNLCVNLETVIFDSAETYELYKAEGVFASLSARLTYDGYSPKPDNTLPWLITGISLGAAAIILSFFAVYYLNRQKHAPAVCAESVALQDECAAAAPETEEKGGLLNCSSGAISLPPILTRREREIALLMLAGKKRKEIAAALYISESTIKTHANNILYKTECRDQVGFIIKYKGKE